MILSIDRFEGDCAVCVDDQKNRVEIPRCQLPAGVREGDCLRSLPEGGYALDREAARQRREEILRLSRQLFRRRDPKPQDAEPSPKEEKQP